MFQELYIDPIYIMWDVGWDDGFGCGLGRRFRMWAGTTVSILGRRFRSWDDGLGITQRRWFQRNPHLLKNGPKIEGNPLCRGYIFWALLQKGSHQNPSHSFVKFKCNSWSKVFLGQMCGNQKHHLLGLWISSLVKAMVSAKPSPLPSLSLFMWRSVPKTYKK